MNWQSVVVLAAVAALFIAVVVGEILKRRNGKASCACGCEGCAMKDSCHK